MNRIAIGGLILALAAAGPAWAQASAFLSANLQGQEVPNRKGDDTAGANFNGEFNLRGGKVCYYLDMDGLDDANGVYVRSSKEADEPAPVPEPAADPAAADPAAAPAAEPAAPAGRAAPALTLKVPGPDGDEVCVDADKAVLERIAAAPGDFYIEIVTPDHPDGAVRGTLKK